MKNPFNFLWNKFWAKWNAETPKLAKKIKRIAITVIAVVPSAWVTFQGLGITLPEWFSNSVGYITFASAIIAGVAGTRTKKGGKDEAT